jgi:DNA-binding PadR family transcriptional regulator
LSVLALGALLLAQATAASSPSPSVHATASKDEVTLGEPFQVEVRAEGPAGTVWTFPPELRGESAELRALPEDPQAPLPAGLQRYEAAVFGLGEVELPALKVGYRLTDGTSGEAAVEPLTLIVGSLLPRDPKEQKLADIRSPLPLEIGPPFWYASALALAALACLVAWLLRRRRIAARPAVAPAPEVSADAEALAALERLRASGVLERQEHRAFYIALTEIGKRYLERRLQAPVLEMTSSEAVAFLRDHEHGRALAMAVRELASAADQVKFARGEGRAEEALRHLAAVRQLVGDLEARLRPAPTGAPGGQAA